MDKKKSMTVMALAAAAGLTIYRAVQKLGRVDGKEKSVLITGGSSGIGLELARIYAEHGYQVILAARDEERLRQAA